MTGGCQHVRANGTACRAVVGVNADGLCLAHTSDGASRMAEISRKGGQATAARFASVPFVAEDVPRIETLEDAKLALDNIRIAVLTRRITHAEGNAASKAVSEWCKAEGMAATGRLVTELPEVSGRIAPKRQPFTKNRMQKTDRRGMQRVTLFGGLVAVKSRRLANGTVRSVVLVPDNRMSDVRQVDPNLVVAAGVQHTLNQ